MGHYDYFVYAYGAEVKVLKIIQSFFGTGKRCLNINSDQFADRIPDL